MRVEVAQRINLLRPSVKVGVLLLLLLLLLLALLLPALLLDHLIP